MKYLLDKLPVYLSSKILEYPELIMGSSYQVAVLIEP